MARDARALVLSEGRPQEPWNESQRTPSHVKVVAGVSLHLEGLTLKPNLASVSSTVLVWARVEAAEVAQMRRSSK